MTSEYRKEPRILEEWFDYKLPKDFDDDGNEANRDSTKLDYFMYRAMVIYHKKYRATLNILLKKLKIKLLKKERRDACELEKPSENK